MGFSISWIAFKSIPLTEAALAFGLTLSGQSDEVFDYDLSGTRVGDWSIVIFNDVNPGLTDEMELARLSRGGDIVVVHVIETTMTQTSERWLDGRRVWSVWHDAQLGNRHLEVEGDLPPAYEDIKRKRVAEQEEEDAGEAAVDFISEIPLDLAEQITNFRHDRIGPEFFELVPGDAQKPKKAGFMSIFTSLLRGGRS
ncbi:MAG: hypothetical protein KF694_02255 [Mesorhizobium sp.]|nr:hypothetical protein [Mesorhizobium sp.]